MFNRRSMLRVCAASGAALLAPSFSFAANESTPRKKIAFLGTVVTRHSHAQHFLDRLTLGYSWRGDWLAPRCDVASVYIDQVPAEGDLSKERIARHKLKQFPTIAEALTLGTSKLAVDGVVIIGEHGKYEVNDRKQTLYPRYEWFKECVKVFEASGRSVPIFNDKHLSTTWPRCTEMVADAKRLGFAFLAGSSLPVTWRFPQIDMPYDAKLRESVCVGYGGPDSYDFHGLETAQCMSERRAGGEIGIKSVHALRGAPMWEMLAGDSYKTTRELMVAALNRSHNLPVENGYPTDKVTFEWARKAFPEPLVYFIEHRDGFRTTLFLMAVHDFNYAGRLENGETISCQMYLPMPGSSATTADFFTPQIRHIESMIETGKAPYPAERTLLTSGMVIAGVESIYQGHKPIATPEMAVKYVAPRESMFRRE